MAIIYKNNTVCEVRYKGGEPLDTVSYKGKIVHVKADTIRIEASGPFTLPPGVTEIKIRFKANGGGGGGGHGGQTADVFQETDHGGGGFGGEEGTLEVKADPDTGLAFTVLDGETLDIQFGTLAPGGPGGAGGSGGGTNCRDNGDPGIQGSRGATIFVNREDGSPLASMTGADGGTGQPNQSPPASTTGENGFGTGRGIGGTINQLGGNATGREGAGGGGGGGGSRGGTSCNGGADGRVGGTGALGWIEIIIGGDCV